MRHKNRLDHCHQARPFPSEDFHCQVAILCKEVSLGRRMERLYRKARERHLFFKYENPPRFSKVADGQIQVDLEDATRLGGAEPWSISIPSGPGRLAETFTPSPGTRLFPEFSASPGNRGFFMETNPQLLRGQSNRKGNLCRGACRFPREFSESLIEAKPRPGSDGPSLQGGLCL